MKDFDALTYQTGKGEFNSEDEEILADLIRRQSPGRVLDIGCGDGKLTKKIQSYIPESSIVAIDNSSKQIELANFSDTKISFRHIDIVDYSEENRFDLIYSFYAFPHMPKHLVVKSLKSTKNILEKDGLFFLFTNICLFDTQIVPLEDQEACDIIFLNDWKSQINLISESEMRAMFSISGFSIVDEKRLKTGARVKNYGDMISWLYILK